MPRYKLTIAYDGTDFCGWQKQFPHADAVTTAPRMEAASVSADTDSARPRVELRTVQSVVERAVRLVVHQPVVIHGASRTDSGVHANGQVAAFSTIVDDDGRGRGGWPVERGTAGLVRAINSRLPRDVLVLDAEPVADDFDPIGGAASKGYTYTIWNARERTLWDRRTSLHVWQPLDLAGMQAAAAVLIGEHDFAAFAAAGHGRATTVRTVHGCKVECLISPSQRERAGGRAKGDLERATEQPATLDATDESFGGAPPNLPRSGEPPTEQPPVPQLVRISVSGSGFLWNMVRIIAGTLVEAGKGRLTPDDVRDALATGDRRKAGPTLPAHGLCLEWITYR